MNKESLKKFIDKHIIVNGKFESQRLKEKWLLKNNFSDVFVFLSNNDLLEIEKLYRFLHNEEKTCPNCKVNNRRFVSWKHGYKEYCEKCARKIKNFMKQRGNVDLELDQVIDFVKDKNGKYSTTKIKKLSEKTIQKINQRTSYLDNATIVERLYHIEHNLFSRPKCEVCGNEVTKFSYSTIGYKSYCSNKCEIITNKTKRIESFKRKTYEKLLKKYKNILDNDYDIQMFNLEDYMNNQPILNIKHLTCNNEYSYDIYYQGSFKCPKCYPIRSKVQYEIYEFVKNTCNYDVIYNNRQTIKPFEIDILVQAKDKTIGIEYNSQMFHSFGKHQYKIFDNFNEFKNLKYKDYEKYKLGVQNGIQILNIFSSEWLNESKQKIWKSIIKSKLNCVKNKIYARNCVLKEVPRNEAQEFLEKNHLQGYVNSSIRLGLYYNGKLVSLMTFGKPRRNCWKGQNNYELLRFCSLTDYLVIGAASKLLKHFEKHYKPNLLVSYANCRWSDGNLYERLGFEFLYNTKPNYFYFKPNDSNELLSREKFQKYKLKTMLENFDKNLTEIENMINNGYRIIFDYGNKVYVKNYK